MNHPKVKFAPMWKEELICTMDQKEFVVELTMGVPHVYFPSKTKWESCAPDWAKSQWDRVQSDLQTWCEEQKMPLTIEDHAWVYFDRQKEA